VSYTHLDVQILDTEGRVVESFRSKNSPVDRRSLGARIYAALEAGHTVISTPVREEKKEFRAVLCSDPPYPGVEVWYGDKLVSVTELVREQVQVHCYNLEDQDCDPETAIAGTVDRSPTSPAKC